MSIEAMPKPVYDWFTRRSRDIAAIIFDHHLPITVCAYSYMHCFNRTVEVLDFFLSKGHCRRAYYNYLAGRTPNA